MVGEAAAAAAGTEHCKGNRAADGGLAKPQELLRLSNMAMAVALVVVAHALESKEKVHRLAAKGADTVAVLLG